MASESVKEGTISLFWQSVAGSKASRLKRLLSSKQIQSKTLPLFLRETKPLQSQKLLAASIRAAMHESESLQLHPHPRLSILTTSIAAIKARSLIGKPTRPVASRRKQLSYSELEPKLVRESKVVGLLRSIQESNSSAAILTVGRVVLSFQDLQPLVLNKDPPRKAIQAFFSYLNQGNKSLPEGVRVKIYNIAYVQEVIHMHASPAKRNPMSYE